MVIRPTLGSSARTRPADSSRVGASLQDFFAFVGNGVVCVGVPALCGLVYKLSGRVSELVGEFHGVRAIQDDHGKRITALERARAVAPVLALLACLAFPACASHKAKISESATTIREHAAHGRAALAGLMARPGVPPAAAKAAGEADADFVVIDAQAARVADALPGVQDKPSTFLSTLKTWAWWIGAAFVVALLAYSGLLPIVGTLFAWLILKVPALVRVVSARVRDAAKLSGEALAKNPTPELAQSIAAQRAHSPVFDAVYRVFHKTSPAGGA